MKKKLMLIYILLFISVVINLYLGISSYIKSTYTPNIDDQDILGEMTEMVIQSAQFQKIASRETVYAIKQGVDRFNVTNPSSVFHYGIYVKTDKRTYIFTCTDKFCSNVSKAGSTYSRYSEEGPILPLKKIN